MAKEPSKLISTVDAGAPEQVSALETASVASTADGLALQSEIQAGLSSLLEALASNSVIEQDDPLKQLSEASPAVDAFIKDLQQSIFSAKAATPQGLILAQQLSQGTITKEVFKSSVEAITMDPAALMTATAVDVPPALQKLLLSISNDSELKKLQGILSSATTITPSVIAKQAESAVEVTPPVIAKQAESAFDENDQLDLASVLESTIDLALSDTTIEAIQALISDAEATGQTSEALESLENQFLSKALNALFAKGLQASPDQLQQIKSEIKNFFKKSVSKLPSTSMFQQLKQNGKLKETIQAIIKNKTIKLLSSLFQQKNIDKKSLLPGGSAKAPSSIPRQQSEFKDKKLSWWEQILKQAAKIAQQNLKASAASLLSIRPQPRIMSGARAVIKINGKVTALCTNVTYNINMDWQEIKGIDELLPNDLAPSNYSVTGSMSLYRVPENSPIKNFIHSDMFRGIVWPYTTIEIRDKRTDELLVLVKRCAITSRSESYTHGQPVITTMNFIGVGFRDEETPEFLPDKLQGSESSGGLLSAVANLFKF